MRKLLFLIPAIICFLNIESKGQSATAKGQPATVTTIQVKKADLFSYRDIKPILAAAYPDKDYTNYTILNFDLAGSATAGADNISFVEGSPCGKFTENQRNLLEKYSQLGTVFMLQEITLRERGAPGTPYTPSEYKVISVPNILFSIKE